MLMIIIMRRKKEEEEGRPYWSIYAREFQSSNSQSSEYPFPFPFPFPNQICSPVSRELCSLSLEKDGMTLDDTRTRSLPTYLPVLA